MLKKISIVLASIILLALIAIASFIFIDNKIFKSKTFCDYLNPDLGGAGIMISMGENPVVLGVMTDMPAVKAGIEPGSTVIKVNNKETKTGAEVIKFLRGKIGSKVKVTVKKEDKVRDFELVRERILADNGYFKLADNVFLKQDYLKYENGVYYFYVEVFPCKCEKQPKSKAFSKLEYVAYNVKDNKIAKLEEKALDKDKKLIEEKKLEGTFIEAQKAENGCVYLNFVNDLENTIPKRYKKRLKGNL